MDIDFPVYFVGDFEKTAGGVVPLSLSCADRNDEIGGLSLIVFRRRDLAERCRDERLPDKSICESGAERFEMWLRDECRKRPSITNIAFDPFTDDEEGSMAYFVEVADVL